MPHILSRRSMLGLFATATIAPLSGFAAPVGYRLDAGRSNVGFGVSLGNDQLIGSMPVQSADVSLDFTNIANSRVNVILNASATRMGVFFATDAVRSSDILDVARHPTIAFRSTSVHQGPVPSEAIVTGEITVRDISRSVTLSTQLTQERSTVGQENPELTFILRGAINRNDYGITAYRGLVGPVIQLDIRASIKRN